MRVLIACECSGMVRKAFAVLYPDWEVWSADLLSPDPALDEIKPVRTYYPDPEKWHHFGDCGYGFHYEGDVRDLFDRVHPVNRARSAEMTAGDPWLWHLIIAHPPCDHISYAGARWFKEKQKPTDGRQEAALNFFGEMLHAPSPLVAVENPHSIAQVRYGKATQIVQPWWFGTNLKKGIHLWLKGLPPLVATHSEADYPELFRATTGGGSHRTDKAAGKTGMNRYEDSKGRHNRARMRSKTAPGLAKAFAEQWGAFAEAYYA